MAKSSVEKLVESKQKLGGIAFLVSVASIIIAFGTLRLQLYQNSIRLSQDAPLFEVYSFTGPGPPSETFNTIDEQTSRLCDDFSVDLKNTQTDTANNLVVVSTLLEKNGASSRVFSYTDEYSVDSYIGTRQEVFTRDTHLFCFNLVNDSQDSGYQYGSMFWHGSLSYIDNSTEVHHSQDFYEEFRVLYDKTSNSYSMSYYVMSPQTFRASLKGVPVTSLH